MTTIMMMNVDTRIVCTMPCWYQRELRHKNNHPFCFLRLVRLPKLPNHWPFLALWSFRHVSLVPTRSLGVSCHTCPWVPEYIVNGYDIRPVSQWHVQKQTIDSLATVRVDAILPLTVPIRPRHPVPTTVLLYLYEPR